MKSKYQTQIQPRLTELASFLEAGNPPESAAGWLGISKAALTRHRKNHPELDQLFQQNENLCSDLVEAALLRRATGYADNSGKEIAPDVRAAVFWLQNRRPKRWKIGPGKQKSGKKTAVSIQLNQIEKEL